MKKVFSWFVDHKTTTSAIIAILFMIVHIPMVANHEISLDESATWLLVKGDAEYYHTVYDHSEPQTVLWQWILTPFARAGLPAKTMEVISLILVSMAVFLLFRYVRTHWVVKLTMMFSAVLLYFNPVVARCYSLVPLAIVLLAMFFETRHEKPIRYGISIALLLQTHYMMAGLGIYLIVEFIVELLKMRREKQKKETRTWPILLKFVVPVLIAIVISTIRIVSSMCDMKVSGGLSDQAAVAQRLIFAINDSLFGIDWAWMIVLVLVPAVAYFVVRHAKQALILTVSLAVAALAMIFVYNGTHYAAQKGMVFLAILAFVIFTTKDWPQKKMQKALAVIVCVIPFLATVPKTISAAIDDLSKEFSYSTELAKFMHDMGERSAFMVAELEPMTIVLPVKALGSNNIYNALMRERHEAFRVNESYEHQYGYVLRVTAPSERILKMIDDLGEKYESVYLIMSDGLCKKISANFGPIIGELEPVAEYKLGGYADYPELGEKEVTILFYQLR